MEELKDMKMKQQPVLEKEVCDLCSGPFSSEIKVDGKTKTGPWAKMCLNCAVSDGIGIGLGKGQVYKKKNGEWVKVGGQDERDL